ncbi:oligopeptidase A, partial [Candidatus Uhrbacteria bacterium]|nr:oligopeptidase A [Candidatus Uhrbacteria bacterium]
MFSENPIAQAQTPEGVTSMCDKALTRARQLQDEIRELASAEKSALTWETTFGAFDEIARAVGEALQVPQLMMVAHPDADVRQAAMACEPKVNAFTSALFMDDQIEVTLKHFADRATETSPVHLRFMEHVLRDYRRNGLSLDPNGREELRLLNERITMVGQQFEKHLAENTRWIEIVPEQLAGLPVFYVANHPTNEQGKIRITTDYPDFVPFMRYAHDRQAARALHVESHNRTAKENLPLLDQLIELRHKKAKLLGYPTWADYVLETRMAKSAINVKRFLEDLHIAIKQKREEEFILFREAGVSMGIPNGEPMFSSDTSYLEEIICKKQFQLDSQRVSEYFEILNVLKGIFEMTKRLYGLSFERTQITTWHQDVQAFDVQETSGEIIGRAYLDLYPRDQKYKHAAVFGLRDTLRQADGARVLPIAALVCNFSKPGASPALLSHEEVTTFFHEFGHLLHHLVSTCELASFSGTN